jgi:hypothetical protein
MLHTTGIAGAIPKLPQMGLAATLFNGLSSNQVIDYIIFIVIQGYENNNLFPVSSYSNFRDWAMSS